MPVRNIVPLRVHAHLVFAGVDQPRQQHVNWALDASFFSIPADRAVESIDLGAALQPESSRMLA